MVLSPKQGRYEGARRVKMQWILLALTVLLLVRPAESKEVNPPLFYRYEVPLDHSASRVVAGDFNGDFNLDVALLEPHTNRLAILYGGVSLEDFIPKFFSLPTAVQDIGAADLNSDGISDLVLLTRAPERVLCYYAGAGERLVLKAEIEAAQGAEKIKLVSLLHHTAILLYGQMRGVEQLDFSPLSGAVRRTRWLSESVVADLTVADALSRERLSHLIAYSAVEQRIKLIRTDKDSLLGAVSLSFSQPVATIAAYDFNQNGLPDLAVGLEKARTLQAEVRVLFDVGVQTGLQPLSLPLEHTPAQLVSADLNNDGTLDILALGSNVQEVVLWLGRGSNGYERCSFGIEAAAECCVQDLNGDKVPEVIFTQPTEKQVVIFSSSPPREHRKSSLLWGRVVLSPHPASLMLLGEKSHPLIATLSKGQSSLSVFALSKTVQAQKALALGCKMKRACQLNNAMQFVALSEQSDKVSVFSLKPSLLLEKQAELPILALNITQIEAWQRSPTSALFFLLDASSQEILPQLFFYRQISTREASLSEVTFAPFVPIEQLLFLQSTQLYGQPVVAAIERDKTKTVIARLYTFSPPNNQHVQLFEKAQIRLLKTDQPLHTALCEDFDGDRRPDWLLASESDTWLLLSKHQYKPELLNKLLSLSAQDVVCAMDLNGDRHLDLLVSKQSEQKLYAMLSTATGKFTSLKMIAERTALSDAKVLRIDGETWLLALNPKLHTLDIFKLDTLFIETTATQ